VWITGEIEGWALDSARFWNNTVASHGDPMKRLARLVVLAALACPAGAQEDKLTTKLGDTTDAKKNYNKLVAEQRAATATPIARPAEGFDIALLEKLVLQNPRCTKNPNDVKDIAADLVGKYSIVNCADKIDGVRAYILVPKSKQSPDQQLAFENLKRARFVDHYVVLEFVDRVQYQDVLKPTEVGYTLAGSVEKNKSVMDFEDDAIFIDALKNYMGIEAGSPEAEVLTKLPDAITEAVGTKLHRLSCGRIDKELRVMIKSDGSTWWVWPPGKK
jgi:hypothetical protein